MSHIKTNVTRLIESFDVLPEIFKTLDFNEKSQIINPKDKTNEGEETLAQNIMNSLPFEKYKDLISMDWFYNWSDNARNCLLNKTFEPLAYALDQIENWQKSEEFQKPFIKQNEETRKKNYNNNDYILKNIISFPAKESFKALQYKNTQIDDFFEIWSRSIDLMVDLKNATHPTKVIDKSQNIIQKYEQVAEHISYGVNPRSQLLDKLATQSIAFPIFHKIYSYMDRKKQDDFLIDNEELGQRVMLSGNKKMYHLMQIHNAIKPEDYIYCLTSLSSNAISKPKPDKLDKWILEQCMENLKTEEKKSIQSCEIFGLVRWIKAEDSKLEEFLQDFSQIKTEDILYDKNTGTSIKNSSIVEIREFLKLQNIVEEAYDIKSKNFFDEYVKAGIEESAFLFSKLNMQDTENIAATPSLVKHLEKMIMEKFDIIQSEAQTYIYKAELNAKIPEATKNKLAIKI